MSQTNKNIEEITQLSDIYFFRDPNTNRLVYWVVEVTDTQLGVLQKLDGLKGIEENFIAMGLEASKPLVRVRRSKNAIAKRADEKTEFV